MLTCKCKQDCQLYEIVERAREELAIYARRYIGARGSVGDKKVIEKELKHLGYPAEVEDQIAEAIPSPPNDEPPKKLRRMVSDIDTGEIDESSSIFPHFRELSELTSSSASLINTFHIIHFSGDHFFITHTG